MSCISACSLAPSRASSPVMRPARMAMIRSEIASNSASSEEMARMAMPLGPFRRAAGAPRPWRRRRCRGSAHRRSGSGAERQPAGEHHFLLISAGQLLTAVPARTCGCSATCGSARPARARRCGARNPSAGARRGQQRMFSEPRGRETVPAACGPPARAPCRRGSLLPASASPAAGRRA